MQSTMRCQAFGSAAVQSPAARRVVVCVRAEAPRRQNGVAQVVEQLVRHALISSSRVRSSRHRLLYKISALLKKLIYFC